MVKSRNLKKGGEQIYPHDQISAWVYADVSVSDDRRRLMEKTWETCGRIDILVKTTGNDMKGDPISSLWRANDESGYARGASLVRGHARLVAQDRRK
jgi:hypothetical protein